MIVTLPCSGVSDVFIDIVNVWPHCGDHGSQASCLGKVGDDLSTFNTSVVVFINQQGLYHHKDLQGRERR